MAAEALGESSMYMCQRGWGDSAGAYSQGVEVLLACGVPDLIAEHAILEAALLSEEYSTNCRLFVGLEFVGDLVWSQLMGENQ